MTALPPLFLLASTTGLILGLSAIRRAAQDGRGWRNLLIIQSAAIVSASCAHYFSQPGSLQAALAAAYVLFGVAILATALIRRRV